MASIHQSRNFASNFFCLLLQTLRPRYSVERIGINFELAELLLHFWAQASTQGHRVVELAPEVWQPLPPHFAAWFRQGCLEELVPDAGQQHIG
jgi:hypothetical protein